MSLTKLLPVILLMMATGVQASTRDEIERLWNPQVGRAACTTGSRHISQNRKAGSPLVPPQQRQAG